MLYVKSVKRVQLLQQPECGWLSEIQFEWCGINELRAARDFDLFSQPAVALSFVTIELRKQQEGRRQPKTSSRNLV